MSQTFELRTQPELKIVLNESEFEIIDASEPKNNGIYSFRGIKNVELNKNRTDWFISIISYVVDLFMGSSVGGNFKNKENLKVELENRKIKLWLIDADFEKAEKIVELLTIRKMKYSIPNKRDLAQTEIEFLTYLFEKEKPEWTKIIGNLKVIARCGCGKCPTIMFGETLDSEIQKGKLIIDYTGKSKKGELIGISVFGTDQMPTELEFYSIDAKSEINQIPEIETLKSMTEKLTE